MSSRLNIFTIVLNGMPWLEEVEDAIMQSGADYRWVIVHGVADPVADTSWCQRIETPEDDGTTEKLRQLARYGDRIRVISRPRWPGKTAMCNAALEAFDATTPAVTLQIDADELWTPRQLRALPSLFDEFTDAHAAMFLCRYWFGPRRFVCTPGTYGNNTSYEWVRAWRHRPGMRFERHEPPLVTGAANYIGHAATAQRGFVFDHMAYADRSQIEFKERYYGPDYSPAAWDRLQALRGPVDLSTVLPWVKQSVICHEV